MQLFYKPVTIKNQTGDDLAIRINAGQLTILESGAFLEAVVPGMKLGDTTVLAVEPQPTEITEKELIYK